VSFEPVRASFERLSTAMAGDARWTGHRLALGSAEASLELHIYGDTVFNSFRDVNELGREIFPGGEVVAAGTESVDVRRLDDVVEFDGPILLKSDTQGSDLDVLAGATALMDRIEVVVLELPVRNIYEGAPTMLEMLTRMSDLGFELLGLAPVSRDPAYFRVIEFDGIFVNATHGRA
jgi:FkbM family methyltransferase